MGVALSSSMNGRLVYIGDHQVTFSFGGHAFMAKILEAVEGVDRIAMEAGAEVTPVPERLAGVEYRRWRFPLDWLERSRFTRWHAWWLLATASVRSRAIARAAGLRPSDLVVTVAHDFAWLSVLDAARLAGARCAVFVHDEWCQIYGARFPSAARAASLYSRSLAKADRVLAVSEGMQEHLKSAYAVDSEVFLPPRRKAAVRAHRRERPAGRPFRFAYCGQLWVGYWETLSQLAAIGLRHGWELDIYTNEAGRRTAGKEFPNVRTHAFLPEADLTRHLALEADALVVALPFGTGERVMVETMFSSKMAEYTSTELPVVIMAPPQSNMARWGKAADCFLLIDCLEVDFLEQALRTLVDDPSKQMSLGKKSADLGEEVFSPNRAVSSLLRTPSLAP